MLNNLGIPSYGKFLSEDFLQYLLENASDVVEVEGLKEVGARGEWESPEALSFLCELYGKLESPLSKILKQRELDRFFIDQQTKALNHYNCERGLNIKDSSYQTIIGRKDGKGRIVLGPLEKNYFQARGDQVAAIPETLSPPHVTLFGPPGNAKLCINAMNAFYRKVDGEPQIVEEILKKQKSVPKWGADDEDSKTPIRRDLDLAAVNLAQCYEGSLSVGDAKIQKENRAVPIKRFPGLALPCNFLFYNGNPLPLHLYDFSLHLFHHWKNPNALVFYVPKLENEEEARYIATMIREGETLIQDKHPEYKIGTVRLFIVLENPRAIFRVNEMMDELHPYFAGASLGWHDYLAATARVFKEDQNYKIPVKADPNIVIKHIKGSHELLKNVVGERGGIKIGGMYGILPMDKDLSSTSYQVTLMGYFKDVITQMKRGLNGFWVAHPDFVRIGLAMIEAWNEYKTGDKKTLKDLVFSLLEEKRASEVWSFIEGADVEGLNTSDPAYYRSLLAANITESDFMANNDPREVRYNVFQCLQYLTDWLVGNGCVALPAIVDGEPVRVMDDLATTERSRWEVWHEIYHGRFSVEEFLKIAHEEMHFIRKNLSDDKKKIQVLWNEATSKWYPVAFNIMLKLMTDKKPVEFATGLLLPFTLDVIRDADDPWAVVHQIDTKKFQVDPAIERFNYYFERCGCFRFAKVSSENVALDIVEVENLIRSFNKDEIIEAASFHGNIGENKKTLDKMASEEQALVEERSQDKLSVLGKKYLEKFGIKFLVSAKGKSGDEMYQILEERIKNGEEQELENARMALWEITKKRMLQEPLDSLVETIDQEREKSGVKGVQLALCENGVVQTLCFGEGITKKTYFEMASLSKSVASAFALEYFRKRNISFDTRVNDLFDQTKSSFRIPQHPKGFEREVRLKHLMNHCALNMHYVNGVPLGEKMPAIEDFLEGSEKYAYDTVEVINRPGSVFQYSGGGFLVLEHLIESLEGKSIQEMSRGFLDSLSMKDFTFEQESIEEVEYAEGFSGDKKVPGGRKMFPAFAAGAMGTAESMLVFLNKLERAYHSLEGAGELSHDTAVNMLYGVDRGCHEFMGSTIGLGVFILEGGTNSFALHQGANDGFRSIYMHCFKGPDRGKGLALFCNADDEGVLFNARVCQLILKHLDIEGIDSTQFKSSVDLEKIPQEQRVNIGYKELVFAAFSSRLPERIVNKGSIDPLAQYNLACGADIISVSNQMFARAENLFSECLPCFDPELFGEQGKIMDSWESVRHNEKDFDEVIFKIREDSSIDYVAISTQFHLGNQAEFFSLEGLESEKWTEIIGKTPLQGHSLLRMKVPTPKKFREFRLRNYPDGGISRLALYGTSLAEEEKQKFDGKSEAFKEEIPAVEKPLCVAFDSKESLIGKVSSVTNEHYSPASQILSPYLPINMMDGSESARSREENHSEEIVIELYEKRKIERIELDLSFFVNNAPREVEILGERKNSWEPLVEKQNVKAFAGNVKEFIISSSESFKKLKVIVYPDGGINRLRIY